MSIINGLTDNRHAAQRIAALLRTARGAGDRALRNAAAHAARTATADLARRLGTRAEAEAAIARALNPRSIDDVAVVEHDGMLTVLE